MKRDAAMRVFDSLGDELEEVDVEGNRALTVADDGEVGTDAAGVRSVRLVPRFDCYVIGCHEPGWQRDLLIPHAAGNRVFAGGAGPFPVVLLDGLVAGLWERRRRGTEILVEVDEFGGEIAKRADQVEREATRVGELLGARATLSLRAGAVTTDVRP